MKLPHRRFLATHSGCDRTSCTRTSRRLTTIPRVRPNWQACECACWERVMLKSKPTGFIGWAAVFLVVLTFATPRAAHANFILTFSESGSCSYQITGGASGTCSSVFEPDPSAGPLTSQYVWVFSLSQLTWSGNVNILEQDRVTISDRLRWIDANGSYSACLRPATPCANRMIFYSVSDQSGLVLGPTTNTAIKDAAGNFTYSVPGGTNTYVLMSGVGQPRKGPD